MSLAIKYESVDDASMRLRGTVVLYKGDPVQITSLSHGEGGDDIIRVMFRELPVTAAGIPLPLPDGVGRRRADGRVIMPVLEQAEPKADKRKYISSKHFDIAPFRMGYVNGKNGAFYCSRLPNRVQKQGLCAENFKGVDCNNSGVSFNAFLATPEVVQMVHNDYPSFEVAVAALKKCPSVAFHRDYALVKDQVIPLVYLYHKGAKVGLVENNGVKLGDQFKCLKESLQEAHLKVAVGF